MEPHNNLPTVATQTAASAGITLSERCKKQELIYEPNSLAKTFAMVKTQADAIMLAKAGEPSLCALSRNSTKTIPLIRLNITALDRFLHLKNPLSEEEINFVADQIVEEFGCALTFADIHIVLRDAKAGRYGKFYERLSAPDVLEWFRTYFNARLDAAYEINRQQDKSTYGNVDTSTEEAKYRTLARLGYGINPDGTLSVTPQRLEELDAKRKAKEVERQAKVDEDNKGFASFLQEYKEAEKNGTLQEFIDNEGN